MSGGAPLASRQHGGVLLRLFGLVMLALGAGIVAGYRHAATADDARQQWRQTEGRLRALSINYQPANRTSAYVLRAEYDFQVDGRARRGQWIAGKNSGRGASALLALAAQIEPRAARLDQETLSLARPSIGWEYAQGNQPAIAVRYDPAAPENAEMLFPQPLPPDALAPSWVAWGLGALLALPGLALLLAGGGGSRRKDLATGRHANTPTGILPDEATVYYARATTETTRDSRIGPLPRLTPVFTPGGSFIECFERADHPRLSTVERGSLTVYQAVHVACAGTVGLRIHLAGGGFRDLDQARVYELVERVWFQGK